MQMIWMERKTVRKKPKKSYKIIVMVEYVHTSVFPSLPHPISLKGNKK